MGEGRPVDGAYERELARRRAAHERVTPWRVVKDLALWTAGPSLGGLPYFTLSSAGRRRWRWVIGLVGAVMAIAITVRGEPVGGAVMAAWAIGSIGVMRIVDRVVDGRAREEAERRHARREEIRRRIAGDH